MMIDVKDALSFILLNAIRTRFLIVAMVKRNEARVQISVNVLRRKY